MRRFWFGLITATSVLALAGCAQGAVRLQSELNQSTYDYSNFDLYHGHRDTEVVIYGNPFAMDAKAFADAVTRNMQGANSGLPTNFTTTPKTAEKNLRVVMAFNTDADGYRLCSGKPVASRPQPQVLTLNAAWCWGDSFQSFVEAETGAVSGVEDERFRALVQQTILNLFPREVPVREDQNDRNDQFNP